MTTLEATAIVSKATRCTEATLMAFGIYGIVPRQGSGCLGHIRNAGFKLHNFSDTPISLNLRLKDLTRISGLTDRKFLIFTSGHAMACIDGILIDTMNMGFDNRRIEHIWEVTR